MNTGILGISCDLLMEMLMLNGFKVVDAKYGPEYDEIQLLVEHELIASKERPRINPVYHCNEFGVSRLKDILIDGKSTNEV